MALSDVEVVDVVVRHCDLPVHDRWAVLYDESVPDPEDFPLDLPFPVGLAFGGGGGTTLGAA